jgi:transcriptional regulator GlxA family with amidase domain
MNAMLDGTHGRAGLSVGFILTNNFTLTALSTFMDALRLAADDGDGSRQIRCRWTIMGSSSEPVKSSCGIPVARWEPFQDPRQFDYIVVVGGLLHAGPQLDAQAVDYLRSAAAQGVGLVGVCTGSFVLSRVGLMRNRRCCVSWYHYRDYLEEFPDHQPVADQLYVVDRDRITCAGGAGVADLAAFLIERHLGAACAQKTMHIMLIDKARPPGQSQPQPPTSSETGGGTIVNDRVRRALLLMEQNLSPPLSVEQIARRLSVSTRQFERLFREATGMNPTGFYRILRLRYGHWLLRNSARSVTSIALETGFADCAHFSRQFREVYGISPSELRRDGPPPEPSALTEGLSAVEALALERDLVPPDRRLFE